MAIDIIKRQDQLILSQITFCLDIDSWKRYKSEVPLKWKFVKFEKNNRDEIPESSGVYGFFIKPSVAGFQENSYLIYIGKAGDNSKNNLRKRFMQYYNGMKGDRRPKLNRALKKWEKYIYFYYSSIADKRYSLSKLEEDLNNAFVPPYNENDFSTEVRKIVKVLR